MTIRELSSKLAIEFKDFAKDYDLSEYNYEDISDEFAMDYFGDVYQANLFINSLNILDFMQLQTEMSEFYEDPTLVSSWLLEDSQKLASEIIGYVIRNYVIETMED